MPDTYSVPELIASAEAFFGIPSYVAAGAFYGLTSPMTIDQALVVLTGWLGTSPVKPGEVISFEGRPGPAITLLKSDVVQSGLALDDLTANNDVDLDDHRLTTVADAQADTDVVNRRTGDGRYIYRNLYDVHVREFGAKGDGRIVYNATMATGSNLVNVTDAVSHDFPGFDASTDIGKVMLVAGVGAGNDSMVGAIQAVNSTSQVRVSFTAAQASPDAAGGQIAVYGSDDTSAIQAAIDYIVGNSSDGTVRFDDLAYVVNGGLQQGGQRKANAQITLPNFQYGKSQGRLILEGARHPGGNPFQPFPTVRGTTIISTLVGASYSGTYGVPSVIGGPTFEQQPGGGINNWTGWFQGVQNMKILTPRNPSLSAFNMSRVSANAYKGAVVAGTLSWGYPTTTGDQYGEPTHPQACGFIEPMNQNQQAGSGQHDALFTWGYFCGICPGEHTNVTHYTCQPSKISIGIRYPYTHHARFTYVAAQLCRYYISGWDPTAGSAAAGIVAVPTPNPAAAPNANPGGNGLLIDSLDIEDAVSGSTVIQAWAQVQQHVNDANHQLTGYMKFSRWTYSSGGFAVNQALNITGGTQFVIEPNHAKKDGAILGRTTKDSANNTSQAMTQGAWTAIDSATLATTFNSGIRGWVEIEIEFLCGLAGTAPYHLLVGCVDQNGNYVVGTGQVVVESESSGVVRRVRSKRFVFLTANTVYTLRAAYYLPTSGETGTIYYGGSSGQSGQQAFPNGQINFTVKSMGNAQVATIQ